MKAEIYILILTAILLIECKEPGKTQINDTSKSSQTEITDSIVAETLQSEDDNTPANEDITIEVWKTYLKSDYCDVNAENQESVLALLDKKSNTVASLLLDSNNQVITEENGASSSEEDYVPTVTETFACYPLETGGYLALWYYDASDWGRKIFAVYQFDGKVLKRLKNSFPEFSTDIIDTNPSFEWDELTKLNGTEVVYLKQDCWIKSFGENDFVVSLAGMEEIRYSFNGEKFVTE